MFAEHTLTTPISGMNPLFFTFWVIWVLLFSPPRPPPIDVFALAALLSLMASTLTPSITCGPADPDSVYQSRVSQSTNLVFISYGPMLQSRFFSIGREPSSKGFFRNFAWLLWYDCNKILWKLGDLGVAPTWPRVCSHFLVVPMCGAYSRSLLLSLPFPFDSALQAPAQELPILDSDG